MSKKNKKNQKKVHAKINNTPVKAEAVKKEESKTAKTDNKNVDKGAKAAANKAEKAEKQAKKYAASKARIEARKARKKSIMDKLLDSKKTSDSTTVKTTVEDRKKNAEARRITAYNRYIASIKRRCTRMKLDKATTTAIVNAAKKQWDNAKSYNVSMVIDQSMKSRLEKFAKNNKLKSCVTCSTAFLYNMSSELVDKLREDFDKATIYQYRTDNKSPFDEVLPYQKKEKKPKVGGAPHSIKCSKNRNINFYNWRRDNHLRKALGMSWEEYYKEKRNGSLKKLGDESSSISVAKPVNKKPTQVKEIKNKSSKKAA